MLNLFYSILVCRQIVNFLCNAQTCYSTCLPDRVIIEDVNTFLERIKMLRSDHVCFEASPRRRPLLASSVLLLHPVPVIL